MENQILLEKIGETRTEKLIIDCNKIYMEEFRKEYPNYFESNYLKSICKVITTPKGSNEIKSIGMSCMNDLMTKQFAQFLGGFIGATKSTSGDTPKGTGGFVFAWGNHHGGSTFGNWGRNAGGGSNKGLTMIVGSGTNIPQKDDFANANTGGFSRGMIVNDGSFNAGLNTVTWSGGNSSVIDFTISNAYIRSNMQSSGGALTPMLFLSDLISPVVPVLIGESIFLEYTFQFS